MQGWRKDAKKKKEKVIAFIIRALQTKYKFCRGFSVSRPVKELNGGGKKERKKGRNIKKLGNIYIYTREYEYSCVNARDA